MKTSQFIFGMMLFGQVAFSQESMTIHSIDNKMTIQKLPATLERKELLQNVNYPQYSKPNGHPSQSNIRVNCGCIKGDEPFLFILDGREINGDLTNINTQSVESISVLKHTEFIKQYGDKGKNGVIIITMKRVL
jgi:hypothetical protein